MEKTVYDFGKVVEGKKIDASFVIYNEGDEPLHIEQLKGSHQKIVASCSTDALNPGEKGEIVVTVDTAGTRGKANYGIILRTSDQARPETLLGVSGEVEPLLEFSPPYVFIGQVTQEAAPSGKATLSGNLVREQASNSLKIEYSVPGIEAALEPRIGRRGPETLLKYTLLPSFRAGTFDERIAVVSQDPPARAELRLLGQKLGDIRFEPDRLEYFFGFQEEGQDLNRLIRLESEKVFHINEIKDLSGLLQISLIPVEEGKKYNVHVLLQKRPEGSFLGLMQIYTDLKENPLIDIPIIIGEK